MKPNLTTPYTMSAWIAALMAAQALLGRVFAGQYRDVAWIRATWFGNDLVTLLAVPLLLVARVLVRRGSVRGLLLWLGVLGYSAYNYAYYLLGAALNSFLPLYVALLVLSVATLILALSRIEVAQVAASFRAQTPVRLIGGYLVFVAVGLSLVWFGMWVTYIFAGRPTPVEPEAFKLVAALDTSIMVPLLAVGGVLLWRRSAWGGGCRRDRWHSRFAVLTGAVGERRRRDPARPRARAWGSADLGVARRCNHARHRRPAQQRWRDASARPYPGGSLPSAGALTRQRYRSLPRP